MPARNRLCFLIMLLLVTGILPAAADQPFAFATTPGKLPKNIVPRHYAIEIQPDLEKFIFHGSVTADIEVLQPAREIILNAHDMEVTKATLLGKTDVPLKPKLDLGKQTVSFKLPQVLPPGQYRLALEFTGQIGEQEQGLFYMKYTAPSGQKVILATQMEATDARRMFPCWDEPAFRATFDLTVRLPEKFKAISNMPIERETPIAGGLKEVKFVTTPPMASYLVVLVAGELEEISGEAEGVQIRVITTEGKREQGRYALAATRELLAYYNDYFGIKYPLPKLDQIAIPGGVSGAMENWGGITYNESLLLYDPKTSSEQTRRNIYVDIAHEMSHQWFGNLVTMGWWNNLWLNEGFATWMEVKATDHFNPDWQMWLGAASDKSAVMSGDAHHTTHPIQQAVENENEADDAFDSITYEKGGAILRMLEDYLGPETFRQGIHRYLSAHLYSNATTADLWAALENESGKPIRAVCAGWTEQPGLPMIKIKAECVEQKNIVTVQQQRFTVQDPRAVSLQWEIPISLADLPLQVNPTEDPFSSHMSRRENVVAKFLLKEKSTKLTLPDCEGFLKANFGDHGYYRVLYSQELFNKLQEHLNQLPVADRLNLLNDTWAMVEAERASAADYFALVAVLRDERTLAIWEQILSTLYLIDALEQKQPGRDAFQAYARVLLRPQFQRLGWKRQPGESANDELLRSKVISGLGHFGDLAIISEAKTRFAGFIATPESLFPGLRPALIRIAGRYSDKTIHNQLHELALHAAGTEERQLYYAALASALDPQLAEATLAISLTDETVPQEATDLVIQVADNGEQPELAWEFAHRHIHELLAKVDSSSRNNYVPSIMGSFSDNSRADELEAYVEKNVTADALVKARETGEEIRFKAMLKKRALPIIDHWVKTHSTNGTKNEN